MRHPVVMAEAVLRAPPDVCADARIRFEEIALGLDAVPESSAFRALLGISSLCLVVQGWSFFYSFEGATLRVTHARR